jgi:ribosomal protein S18 acetylase RimI-like enzyme
VDAPQIVATFCDAFHDYPVMRYIVGGPDELYDERLATLIRFFAMARVLRNEPLLGVRVAGDLLATATMSQPANTEPPPGFAELKEETWRRLGPEALARYERCSAAWGPLAPAFPHMHLNMIGVRRASQGLKLGRLLLDHVQEISRNTPGSQGVSLTTELPRNVELYKHVGYELTGYVQVAPGVETWALFRHG